MSYSPTLGRWMEQDPARYVDGSDLYQADGSSPVTMVDPLGLYGYAGSYSDGDGNVMVVGPQKPVAGGGGLTPEQERLLDLAAQMPPGGWDMRPWKALTQGAATRPTTRPPLAKDPKPGPGVPNEDAPAAPDVDLRGVIDSGGNLKVRAALNRIFNTDQGKCLLDQLRGAGKHVRINITGQGQDSPLSNEDHDPRYPNDPDRRQIEINISKKLYFVDTDGQYHLFTVERILAHELGHSAGCKDDGPEQMNNIKTWENSIMSQISAFERANYKGYTKDGPRFVEAGQH